MVMGALEMGWLALGLWKEGWGHPTPITVKRSAAVKTVGCMMSSTWVLRHLEAQK